MKMKNKKKNLKKKLNKMKICKERLKSRITKNRLMTILKMRLRKTPTRISQLQLSLKKFEIQNYKQILN